MRKPQTTWIEHWRMCNGQCTHSICPCNPPPQVKSTSSFRSYSKFNLCKSFCLLIVHYLFVLALGRGPKASKDNCCTGVTYVTVPFWKGRNAEEHKWKFFCGPAGPCMHTCTQFWAKRPMHSALGIETHGCPWNACSVLGQQSLAIFCLSRHGWVANLPPFGACVPHITALFWSPLSTSAAKKSGLFQQVSRLF